MQTASILEVRRFLLSQPAERPVDMGTCDNKPISCLMGEFTKSKGLYFDTCSFDYATRLDSTKVLQLDYPVIAIFGSNSDYHGSETFGDLQKIAKSEEETMAFAKEIWRDGLL